MRAVSAKLASALPGAIAWSQAQHDLYASGQSSATRSTALFATGGVMAAAGAVLYVIGWRRGLSRPRLSVSPVSGGWLASGRWEY